MACQGRRLVCPDVKTNDNACEYYICNMESFFENALFPNQGVIVSIVPFRRSLPYCFGQKDIVFRIRPISTPKTDDSKRLVKFFCSWCMTKSNVLLHWYKLLNIPAKDKWPWFSWHTLWCCKYCLGSLSIASPSGSLIGYTNTDSHCPIVPTASHMSICMDEHWALYSPLPLTGSDWSVVSPCPKFTDSTGILQ